MPRVVNVVEQIDRSGLDQTLTAGDSSNHHSFLNSGKEFIEINNAAVSPVNCTIITPGLVDGQTIGDRVVVCPATQITKIGPFPVSQYGSTVNFDLSDDTTLTLGIFSY